MISRSHRFRGRNDINNVHRRGKNARGPLFAIKALPNPNRDAYRVAIVVSKKVSKSAVERNRIRRRIFACLRALELVEIRPYDIVIVVFQKSLISEPQPNLVSQLKNQLAEAGVIAGHL